MIQSLMDPALWSKDTEPSMAKMQILWTVAFSVEHKRHA